MAVEYAWPKDLKPPAHDWHEIQVRCPRGCVWEGRGNPPPFCMAHRLEFLSPSTVHA